MKSVSYQFISFNRDNGQYYLDLEKVTDVDSLIEEKAGMLVGNQLDRYYFEVLEKLTDDGSPSIVSGYRIWQHELNWYSRKVTRPGYLFFLGRRMNVPQHNRSGTSIFICFNRMIRLNSKMKPNPTKCFSNWTQRMSHSILRFVFTQVLGKCP